MQLRTYPEMTKEELLAVEMSLSSITVAAGRHKELGFMFLYATQDIPNGSLLCEYCGVLKVVDT